MISVRPLVRRVTRIAFLAIGALALVQCVDGSTSPGGRSGAAFAPTWDSRASRSVALLDEGGFPLDRVRIVIIKPATDTLKDTTITVHRGDPEIPLGLTLNVTPGVALIAHLQFKSGETILYTGTADVVTVPLSRENGSLVPVPMVYIGPGSTATHVQVTPASGTFPASGAAIQFTAAAFDVDNVFLANTPFDWTVNDPTLGTISDAGLFTPSGKAGSLIVSATTPKSIVGTSTVTLVPGTTLGPAAIAIQSGNAQIDTVRKTLTSPFVVKVTDVVGNPVSGVTVNWTRLTGFGSPATATSTTNANGLASLTYTLGDIGGQETIRASVTGLTPTVTFTVTVRDGLGVPVATGFAYLFVKPSPASPRVGDTLTFTADSVSASGQSAPVTAQWASDNPGRGAIDANGRLIVSDTGQVIITATRNGLVGHARVTVLPAPMLTGFGFAPKTLNGVSNTALTMSVNFAAINAGDNGITSGTVTITSPTGVTRSCTATTPSNGTARNGSFDCAISIPAGSPTGTWHVTSLVLNGSITRTYGESVLATFGITTLTVNP